MTNTTEPFSKEPEIEEADTLPFPAHHYKPVLDLDLLRELGIYHRNVPFYDAFTAYKDAVRSGDLENIREATDHLGALMNGYSGGTGAVIVSENQFYFAGRENQIFMVEPLMISRSVLSTVDGMKRVFRQNPLSDFLFEGQPEEKIRHYVDVVQQKLGGI